MKSLDFTETVKRLQVYPYSGGDLHWNNVKWGKHTGINETRLALREAGYRYRKIAYVFLSVFDYVWNLSWQNIFSEYTKSLT